MFKFLKEVKEEMKHVSWPTQNQAIGYTVLVIILSIAIAMYLGAFDWGFAKVIKAFVN